MLRGVRVFLAASFLLLLSISVSGLGGMPTGFNETEYATGMLYPTAMAFAPDGRLFVLEQGGRVRIVPAGGGAALTKPALNIPVDSVGERGLLGIAFDPKFTTNRHIYLYHTVPGSPAYNQVVRYTMKASNPNVADPATATIIFTLDPLIQSIPIHNGGAMHFGADGKLYIAVGDGYYRPNAQSLSTVKGKILRINKDGTIPAGNPFFSQTTGINRAIWAMGLRNPFTFAIDPDSGRMHINDVGNRYFEEVNLGAAGANYGWPDTEGTHSNPAYANPIYAYPHQRPVVCAITGGTFYRSDVSGFPAEYDGDYFFSDYCGGFLHRIDLPGGTVSEFAPTTFGSRLVDLDIGPDGALYYLALGEGAVYRVAYTNSDAAYIIRNPSSVTGYVGASVSFDCPAGGPDPISWVWTVDDLPQAETGATFTMADLELDDSGSEVRCQVSNGSGTPATSTPATLTVLTNTKPVAQITSPLNGATFQAGDIIQFAGSGSDAEDGNLSGNRLTWRVDFHHGEHIHPFVPPTRKTKSGSFAVPALEGDHTDTDIFYRIHLSATDSRGAVTETFVDVHPELIEITVDSIPSGMAITLDGMPHVTPITEESVAGKFRAIGAPLVQGDLRQPMRFDSWSDDGAITHYVFPEVDTSYTVTFVEGSATELLTNGSFEQDANLDRIPDGWPQILRLPVRKCLGAKPNGKQKNLPNEGLCMLYIAPDGTVQQSLKNPAVTVGASLQLSAYAEMKNNTGLTFARVLVKFVDGSKDKDNLSFGSGTTGWVGKTGDLIPVTGAIKSIRVKLSTTSHTGKTRFDTVSLRAREPAEIRALPLPAPNTLDGFRAP